MNYHEEIEILQYFVEARLRRDAGIKSVISNTTFTISDILHRFYKNYRNKDWAVQEVKNLLNELTNLGVLFKIPNFGPKGGFGYSFNKASIDAFKVFNLKNYDYLKEYHAKLFYKLFYDEYYLHQYDISDVAKKIASKIIKRQQKKTQIKVCRCNKCGAFKKKKFDCKNCLNKKTIKNYDYGYKIYQIPKLYTFIDL